MLHIGERAISGRVVKHSLVTMRIAVLLAAVVATQGADVMETLLAKRARLEQELAGVNSRIQKLETTQSDTARGSGYLIKEFGTWRFDSAGGVEPYFVFEKPDKARSVKYISIQLQPYDASGDIVDQTADAVLKKVNFISPFASERAENRSWWEPVRYGSGVRCLKVSAVRIAFADGKTQSYTGKALKKVFAPEVKNECVARKAS